MRWDNAYRAIAFVAGTLIGPMLTGCGGGQADTATPPTDGQRDVALQTETEPGDLPLPVPESDRQRPVAADRPVAPDNRPSPVVPSEGDVPGSGIGLPDNATAAPLQARFPRAARGVTGDAADDPPPLTAARETGARDAPAETAPPTMAEPDPPPATQTRSEPAEVAADSSSLPGESVVLDPAEQPFDLVTLFYATDREAMGRQTAESGIGGSWWPAGIAAAIAMLLAGVGAVGWKRRWAWSGAALALIAAVMLGACWGYAQVQSAQQEKQLVRYGNQRGELQLGTCEVSIPRTHQVGEVERPSILRLEVREDARKHVVLQKVVRTAEDTFFEQLRQRVQAADRAEAFVFVHGYNVTFEGAAQRTAQIAYDVGFAGAPIFFSWPSQGGLLKYTVDENNVEWAVPHLRQFLLDVVRRSGASSVSLVAHSMGNRALTAALRELRLQLQEETALFNQIILAAPDVDAEIFRRDLAPALVQSARHVTLYASSNDQALAASKQVHGYARAGESGADLVVVPGIETVDVSALDTSLLGHSYYGSSNPILVDIGQLIHRSLPAAERRWLLPRPYGDLTYWVFEKASAAATGSLIR